MTHPTELSAAAIVNALRLGLPPQQRPGHLHLCEGAYISWDAQDGGTQITARPERGMLFHIAGRLARPPGWLTLNLALREGSFAPGDVLGLVIELEGCTGQDLPVFMRTGRGGNTQDTRFADRIAGGARRSVQTLLHQVSPGDALCGHGFHTLVLELPQQDFTLELRDLRLFVLSQASRLTAPTLAQAG